MTIELELQKAIDVIKAHSKSLALVADLGGERMLTIAEGMNSDIEHNIVELVRSLTANAPDPETSRIRYAVLLNLMLKSEWEGELIYEDKEA